MIKASSTECTLRGITPLRALSEHYSRLIHALNLEVGKFHRRESDIEARGRHIQHAQSTTKIEVMLHDEISSR